MLSVEEIAIPLASSLAEFMRRPEESFLRELFKELVFLLTATTALNAAVFEIRTL